MPKQFRRKRWPTHWSVRCRNAKHLRAKDAATVAAARALAWKIDHWDELAEQAISDAEAKGKGARPAVPQNDNTRCRRS